MTTSNKMSLAQATIRNDDEFTSQLAILHKAAVGVILCRTREPYRAIDCIRNFAAASSSKSRLEFKTWTILHGWLTPDLNDPAKKPDADGTKDPVQALGKIGGISDNSEGFPNGFYCMMYPHFWLKDKSPNVSIIQTVKDYSKMFSETKRRLVLVVPPEFTLPSELQDDVVVVDYETPSYAEMSTMYDRLMESFGDKAPNFEQAEKDRILAAAAGMAKQEFDTALARALVASKDVLPNAPIEDIVAGVMAVKVEMVKRSEVLEVMPVTDMSQVGGLDNLKEWVTKRAPCFSQEARDFGIEPPKGIALIGPPGTGKSLCAKSIASLLGLPLIKFDVSRIFNSLVGESESRVRAALKMIDAMAPCVVMLDEVDKAFQIGSGGDSGVSQRVLGLILTHLQESPAAIFWVASANRVNNLPSEFLRRGRLDEVFSVSVPDASERLEILQIHLRKRGKDPDQIGDLEVAAEGSDGYVPAELEAAVKDAIIEAFHSKQEITGELIMAQLAEMKPLSEAFEEDFTAMQTWAEQNARPANKSTERRVRRNRRARSAAPAATGQREVDLDG